MDPYAVALSSGIPNDLTADFGYEYEDFGEGLVGDYVWYDLDGDSVQDSNESGIEGVTVALFVKKGSNYVFVGSRKTDANGPYYFPHLDVGGSGKDYRVNVVDSNFDPGGPLEGMAGTNQPDNTDDSTKLTSSANVDLSLDFGYKFTGVTTFSLGDYVWEDTDADGVQDPAENGIEGVTISLFFDADGDGVIDGSDPLF